MHCPFLRFTTLILFVFLSACATTPVQNTSKHGKSRSTSGQAVRYHNGQRVYPQSKDSAPKGPLPSQIKPVKPKYEPYSRYGNPESYAVDGRTYRIMRSTQGYKKRGLASWYGTKFHSQRTSSGEKYDMYAMTAAHKTLPLPSYVRVRNLKNGREAIVKINDRGPFHSDRIIDLSYAAATKLGVLPNGTAPVEIEAVNVGLGGRPHVAQYYIQAGAFGTRQLAQSLQSRLKKAGSARVTVETHQNRYIVKVGPFSSRQMSDRYKNQLSRQGIRGAFTLLQ
ncbi:septal ring lytic transglycosylase RlpA family protein [Legionella sp. CNM-4043-24]|uniref:septal ring lytic transglycosylase RlpA family protein n=1 Tax=Legionella sp. CNM-4043-24 TaxID=3421646 RepID=UPI00403AFCEE